MRSFYDRDSYIFGNIITADDKSMYMKKIKLIESRKRILELIRERDSSKMVADFLRKVEFYNPDHEPNILWAINEEWDANNPELKTLLLCSKSDDLSLTISTVEALSNDLNGFEEIKERYHKYYWFLLIFPYINFETLEMFPIKELERVEKLCRCLKIDSNAREILSYKQRGIDNESIIQLSERIKPKLMEMRIH